MEDSGQSRQHRMSLLLHCREITADAAKSGGSSRTAKGASNLLLNFGPAQIPLGLVVGKRNAQVVEQRQHLLGTRHQGIQQILGLALLLPAFLRSCRRRRWGRLSGIASRQHLERARDPVVALESGNSAQVAQTPLLTRTMQIEQEVVHLGSPLLMLLLGHCHTVSHEVGSTDAVNTRIGIIAGKTVVHASPAKARPDADLVHGLPASRRMPGQMGQQAGAIHMQPMQHPIHADAGLISMLEVAGNDQLSNVRNRGCQPLCRQFTPLDQGAFRDLASAERSQRLAGTSCWQQLPLVQIDGQRLQVRSILDRCADRSRKSAQAGGVTGWATDGFDLMLVGQQAVLATLDIRSPIREGRTTRGPVSVFEWSREDGAAHPNLSVQF